MTEKETNARRQLVHALRALTQYGHGTVGHREAVEKLLPNAIEKMIEAKLDARQAPIPIPVRSTVDTANDEIVRQMKQDVR